MSVQETQQEGQKTVVAFIAGLLIGGLLVWVFSGNPADQMSDDDHDRSSKEYMEDDHDDDDHDHDDHMHDDDADEMDDSQEQDTNETNTSVETDSSAAPAVAELPTGTGSITVSDQKAGSAVVIDGATFPNDEGWIGVRTLVNGSPVGVLGVARFSKEQGLVPSQVELVAPTRRGGEYVVVYYTESGDREFSLANDVQIEGVFETFTAQ